MAEPRSSSATQGVLAIRGLNVFYGSSHALQGVDLNLARGVLSVVGRNGMGKTTMCKAIMGLVRASSGSIRIGGEETLNLAPAAIARLGVGYVPQGRRLWRSLTVDEHLRLVASRRGRGAWSIERIYDTFPRLAERRGNGGGQLSGGEQQMLAISRALLANPRLLIMDEPTEGLAPVIVAQVEDMLVRLGEEGEMSILVIEQNIGVATAVSDTVAIMVNGRINRVMESARLAADRALQQRLLGVGRHAHEDAEAPREDEQEAPRAEARPRSGELRRIYVSNPTLPTRWSQPVPVARIEAASRVVSASIVPIGEAASRRETASALTSGPPTVIVAGTLDTKYEELAYIRDTIAARGLRVRLVDLSTSGRRVSADVTASEIALAHPRASAALASGDRGVAVAAMAEAFAIWIKRQNNVAGIISAGGSGATALATPAMRALPVGVPKVMISTVASGNVAPYVGPSDIMMMYSVTDIQGLNTISRDVLGNGAHALAGMVEARLARRNAETRPRGSALPTVGMTMFGVTTLAVQQVVTALKDEAECMVFHATGTGGQSMEKLVESGHLTSVIDLTTTEVCDLLFGGVLPATEDRFGAIIRTRVPYIGSVGALDMVNFQAPETVPQHYAKRKLYAHNPAVTLMRTTPEENTALGRWIGERLNRMEGLVRFFLPEAGVSALDRAGQPFDDPEARAALFAALESTVRKSPTRQIIRVPHHINDPAFAALIAETWRMISGSKASRRRVAR